MVGAAFSKPLCIQVVTEGGAVRSRRGIKLRQTHYRYSFLHLEALLLLFLNALASKNDKGGTVLPFLKGLRTPTAFFSLLDMSRVIYEKRSIIDQLQSPLGSGAESILGFQDYLLILQGRYQGRCGVRTNQNSGKREFCLKFPFR